MSVQHDFYVLRADEARADAERAVLANVKERCLRAAAAWQVMADRAHRAETGRAEQEERKRAERAA
jgi:hypothetical protein